MAARAIWKAELVFADVRLPVKLYAAVRDRNIHFHLLHDQDQVRLRQKMVNSETGKEVPRDQAVKGYEVERGRFVILDEQELQSLEPAPSREIDITRFVDPAKINHQWYDRPYYLGPDADDAADYFAFAEALARQEKEGVAQWAMRNKSYVGALRSDDGYLVLQTLRHAGQVISADQLDPPAGREFSKQERAMAEQLVEALAGDFDPHEFRDEYRDQVRAMIDKKSRGEQVAVEEYEPPAETDSLVESLQASLAHAK